jgi:hypothetical protein
MHDGAQGYRTKKTPAMVALVVPVQRISLDSFLHCYLIISKTAKLREKCTRRKMYVSVLFITSVNTELMMVDASAETRALSVILV